MLSTRKQIIKFIIQGTIAPEKVNKALQVSKVTPNGDSWRYFMDRFLLLIGGLSLALSVVFFIAFNWNDIGRFAKFGLVEVVIIIAIFSYWKTTSLTTATTKNFSGKVALLVASIFLGVLLALYGQTYQTGADPWQLFFYWAVLITPWTIIARFPTLWIVWLLLINLSTVLYFMVFRNVLLVMFSSDMTLYWLLFGINTSALFVWEYFATRFAWLAERWAVRLLAVIAGFSITWLVVYSLFEYGLTIIPLLVWGIWLGVVFYLYRILKHDLFMLAGCCLMLSVVVVSYASKMLLSSDTPSLFLFISLLVIALGTGSAIWLRKVHREWLA